MKKGSKISHFLQKCIEQLRKDFTEFRLVGNSFGFAVVLLPFLSLGVQGGCSGLGSILRLGIIIMQLDLLGSLLFPGRFFSRYSGFPLSLKTNI